MIKNTHLINKKEITEIKKREQLYFTTIKDVHFKCQVKLEMLTKYLFLKKVGSFLGVI